MEKKQHRTRSLKRAAREYLAKTSERELARLLRSKVSPDFRRRNRRQAPVASNRWQKWEWALLGKCPDRDAARQTGRTLKAIIKRRRRLESAASCMDACGSFTAWKIFRHANRGQSESFFQFSPVEAQRLGHSGLQREYASSCVDAGGRITARKISRLGSRGQAESHLLCNPLEAHTLGHPA